MVGAFLPACALTEQELVAKLEAAGYSQIRDIKATAEGTAVRAIKNGKKVSLVVQSKSAQLTMPRGAIRFLSCSLAARGNVYLPRLYATSGDAHSTLLYLVDGSRHRPSRPLVLD
jgi:hypothetical protein